MTVMPFDARDTRLSGALYTETEIAEHAINVVSERYRAWLDEAGRQAYPNNAEDPFTAFKILANDIGLLGKQSPILLVTPTGAKNIRVVNGKHLQQDTELLTIVGVYSATQRNARRLASLLRLACQQVLLTELVDSLPDVISSVSTDEYTMDAGDVTEDKSKRFYVSFAQIFVVSHYTSSVERRLEPSIPTGQIDNQGQVPTLETVNVNVEIKET